MEISPVNDVPRRRDTSARALMMSSGEADARIVNALTVDVEDYFQVSAFEKHIPRELWAEYPQRVEGSTQRILHIMENAGVRGTFFILGWVARRYPKLVQEILACGHEIGIHSDSHRLIYEMTPEAFRADLREGKAALEDAAGLAVEMYRAPSFSITQKSLWALEILVQEGIRYDSSIFPIFHDRYGIPDSRTDIHTINTPSGPLHEFPPSVFRFFGKNLPVSGGGYFRLYAYSFSRFCLRSVNRKTGQPFIFYIHPWEVDPEQPRLPFGSRVTRFRHRVGLRQNAKKFSRLLNDFSFAGMREVMDQHLAAHESRSLFKKV